MNRIKVGRLILSGFITLLVFIGMEIVVEGIVGRQLAVAFSVEEWYQIQTVPDWRSWNWVLNILIAFVNSLWLMWLYAALRPMFGVGIKTALITSAFAFVFLAVYSVNMSNLGLLPAPVAFVEMVYIFFELPVSVVVGAEFYERG